MKPRLCILTVALCCLFPLGLSSQRIDPKPTTLTPQEVFKRVSPSVFIVEALDSGGKVVAFGSGVAVAPDQIVTNNHVVDEGSTVRVKRGQAKWPAKVTHVTTDHDLCRLQVEGLKAVAVQVRKSSTLEVGERVYAIGAPQGLELTFSEGVVSALRDFTNGRIIQTTAPISSGSSGGGLFDTQGRLVGITSAGIIEGQNLNFAVPSEWVLALEGSPAPKTPSAGKGDKAAGQALQRAVLCLDLTTQKQYRRAVAACREAIRLQPNDATLASAWTNLGLAYAEFGQSQQAIEAFKEAIRLKPDYAVAWYNLGITHVELGQLQEALEAFKEAIRLKPDFAYAWTGLGTTYGQLGQRQQALGAHKEATRLKPDDARAWYNLGIAYSRLGNRAKVMEVYQRLKALDPDRAQKFFDNFILP